MEIILKKLNLRKINKAHNFFQINRTACSNYVNRNKREYSSQTSNND